MAKTYTTTVMQTGERLTYTVYARYTVDTYQDGTRRFFENNNLDRSAVVKPLPDEGRYEVCLMDEPPGGDFYTSGYVRFDQERDAILVARAWVTRGK